MTAPSIPTPLASEQCEQHKAHGANWLKWLHPFIGKPGVRGLELGVWLGESTEWFMEHVCTDPTSAMDGVDTFAGSDEHRLAGIDCAPNEKIARARLARFNEGLTEGQERRVTLHKMTTDAFLLADAWRRPRYHFAYVDADHSAPNALRDGVLTFEFLHVGGVMIFDDYEWKVMADEIDRPGMAIDAFLACYARRIEVIGLGWQVAVKKVR